MFLQLYVSRRCSSTPHTTTFDLQLKTRWVEEAGLGCLRSASEIVFICPLNFDSWICKLSLLERSDTVFVEHCVH